MKAKLMPRAAALLAAACLALPAAAADKPKDASRRLQQQLRQAEQEKTQLAQDKAAAEGQVKALQDKLTDAQRRAEAAARRNAQLGKELAAGKAELAATAEKLTAAERRIDEQQRAFAVDKNRLEQQKRALETAAAQQATVLAGCRERNDRMYKLGYDLLDKYERKGCWAATLQAEPFTGLQRAQIEKMAEEDREKLDRDQLLPPPVGGAAAKDR